MGKKQKKPSRRPFGRPKDGPGPQDTFEGAFQVEQAQAQPPVEGSQHTITPAQAEAQYEIGLVATSSVHRSNSAPERGRRGRRDGASLVRHGERRPSIGAHSVASASSARASRREPAEDPSQPGPSGRRRPSIAGHRPTQSHPNATSTVLAAGGQYRSHSSTMLAAEMSPDGNMSAAGPSSWPRAVQSPMRSHPLPDPLLQPMSPIAYRGADRPVPFTPSFVRGQYPTPGLTPSMPYDTPSTSSLPLLSPPAFSHRPRTYEPPELSPTDPLYQYWRHHSSVPATPLSMRGGSIPPSVQSESPYMGSLFEFSPGVGPIGGPMDVPELPPLSPDPVAEGADIFWGHEGGGVPVPSAGTAPANNDPMLLGPAQYPPTSVAVPEQQPEHFSEFDQYGWPQGTVASSGPAFCWPQIDINCLQEMPQGGYSEPHFGPSSSAHGYSPPPGGAPGPGQ